MSRTRSAMIIGIVGFSGAWGCHPSPAPPPPRVPVPAQTDLQNSRRESDDMRPLPPPSYEDASAQPPFADPPLVSQRPPEQRAFVDAYRRAGSPRITLFVSGMEAGDATSIDFDAVETIMTDWIACNGQVTLIAPTIGRRRLSNPQTREDLAQQLGADIVIYVQAASTRQSSDGKDLRIVAQAINTKGGEQIGRAVVDVPPKLDKPQINDYTRYLSRKLMDDMTESWTAAPARAPSPPPAPN